MVIHVITNDAIDVVIQNLTVMVSHITTQVMDNEQTEDDSARYKNWVSFLMEEMSKWGFLRRRELASLLCDNKSPDLANLVKELLSYIQKSLKNDIMRETDIPTDRNQEEVKKFLGKLFVDPSDDILRGMCFEQCPICNAACENNWPAGSYHEHTTSTHIPRGLRGIIRGKTKQLMLHDCLSCVESTASLYEIPGDKRKHLCRNYKDNFPSWSIKPQGDVPNYEKYWQWVMVKFNRPLAEHFNCNAAHIPQRWGKISKREASSALAHSVTKVPFTPGAMLDMQLSEMANHFTGVVNISTTVNVS